MDLNQHSFMSMESIRTYMTIMICTSLTQKTFKEDSLDDVVGSLLSCNDVVVKKNEPEHSLLQPLFNWLPINLIKKTFELHTQHARTPASSLLKKTY